MSKIPTRQMSTSPAKVVFRPRQNTAAAATAAPQRKSLHFPLKIGDRVISNGKSGTVAFMGPTKFAEGEWIGINLDEALGKNDGSYGGHRYFETDPNHGLFCRPDTVQRLSINGAAAQRKTVHDPTRLSFLAVAATTTSLASHPKPEKVELKIGDRVLVSGTRTGTVKYIGLTHIKEGTWCGIKLDQPNGKHNGKLDGQRYFRCSHRHGLFAPIHRVEKLAVDRADVRQSTMSTDSNDLLLDDCSSHTSLLSEFSSSSNEIPLRSPKKARQSSLSTDLTAMETSLSSQVAELRETIKEKDMFIRQLHQQKIERDRYETSKLDSLENQLAELEQLCQKKEYENEKLEKEQLEMMEKIEDLQYQVEEYELAEQRQSQVTIPEDHRLLSIDQIRIYERSIEKIQELESLNQQLTQENHERMQSLQLELDNWKRNEQSHLEKEARLQEQLQGDQLKIAQLNQAQNDLRTQLTAFEQSKPVHAEVDFYREQLAEYQTTITHATSESEQVRAEVQSLQNANQSKAKQIEELRRNYDQIELQLKNRGLEDFAEDWRYSSLLDQEIDSTLKEYRAKYEQQIQDYEKDLNRATEETERIRVELAKFAEEKTVQEERTSSLKDEYEDSRRQAQDASQEESNQTIEKLKKDCAEYQREIEEFMERECKANKTFHQREAQFDQQVEDYREKLNLSDEQIKQLTDALREFKQQNQLDTTTSKESERKIEQLLLEIQSLHSRLQGLEDENFSKENQLNHLRQKSEEQTESVQQTQSEYERKIQSFASDRIASEQRANQYQTQIEELQSKLISNEQFELLRQKFEDLQAELEQERQSTARLHEQLRSNELELGKQAELSNTIHSLSLELDSLKIELTNREQTHQQTLNEYDKLQEGLTQKEKSIYKECRAQCEQEMDGYQKDLELSIQRIGELQSELRNVQEEKELDEKSFQEKFDLFQTDCEKRIDGLRQKNQALEKENENTSEQLKDYQSAYEQSTHQAQQIEDLTEKNKRLKSELEQLANSKELEQLAEQLNQLQEMHKDLLERHAQREKDYQQAGEEREKQVQQKVDEYDMKLAMMKSEFLVEMENTKLDHDQEVLRLKGQLAKTQAPVQKGKK